MKKFSALPMQIQSRFGFLNLHLWISVTPQKELFTSTKQVNDSRPRFESSFKLLSSQLGTPRPAKQGTSAKTGGKGCISGGEQKEGAGRPTRRWLSSLARLGIGLARRQMNVRREAGFARRALAGASPASSPAGSSR